jgi:4-hydroxy-tetrahydrodipicolinate synthase
MACKSKKCNSSSGIMDKIKGSIVAIVTPFKDGKLDEEGLKSLIEWHIESGTHCIVPCGTTGESATLSYEEHEKVVEITIKTVNGRAPVIAGTGSNSTEETIMLTNHAKKAGADAALLITPYYNKPTQEGLYLHFIKIAESCEFPMILYNVPSRTAVNMLPSTVARCAQNQHIIGIKEATGDLKQVTEVIRQCPEDFIVLSGDDFTALPLMAVGGKGVISVAANVMPSDMSKLMDLALAGKYKEAREINERLFPLYESLFFETNPTPAKTALSLIGKISSPEVRLPLAQMSDANIEKLKKVISSYSLI